MKKRLIGLGAEGKLTLRLPDGQVRPLDTGTHARAFILLDCSGSMAGAKLENAKRGIRDFVTQSVAKGYSVGIVSFHSHATLICPASRDIAAIVETLPRISAQGSTNLTAALKIGSENLAHLKGSRAIVIATDGFPDDAVSSLAVAEHAKSIGIEIITIGTEDADHEFLRRIATSQDFDIPVGSDQISSGLATAARLLTAPQ